VSKGTFVLPHPDGLAWLLAARRRKTQETHFMVRHCTFSVVTLAMVLLCPLAVRAQQQKTLSDAEAAFLKQMPDPARVVADIHGSNSLDTNARQYSALDQLNAVIREVVGDSLLSPEQKKTVDIYDAARRTFKPPTFDHAETMRLLGNSPEGKWNHLTEQYKADPPIRGDQILGGYMGSLGIDNYHAIYDAHHNPKPAAQTEAAPSEGSKFSVDMLLPRNRVAKHILGGVVLLGCAIIVTWIGRRRFDRSTYGGSEEFASYGTMLVSKLSEGILGIIALALGILGLILLMR
jgi:hypothetical protein